MSLQRLVGSSPALAGVREALTRLIARPAAATKRLPPVLITGETGTGKGLIAHLIHETGPRATAAFVDVNCAAIPDTLLEAELFGFERGAFTDASHAKAGLLQVAHRGTIFLDEIGLLPDALQVKLLKAIEDRSVRRLGSTRPEAADAWVLAATSEDLAAAIAARRFRADLYHRLAVVTIQLPPLRDRGDDVVVLARHYLDRACNDYGLPMKSLGRDAEAALTSYSWPGNVRELANLMERVALLTDAEQVDAAALHLPRTRPPAGPLPGTGVNEQVASVERSRIEEALHLEGWNISRAASRLGLPRNTLRYRMERHGLLSPSDDGVRRVRPDVAPAPREEHETPPRAAENRSPVRWQRARVTLLYAEATGADPSAAEHDRVRLLEQVAAKVSAFGGRVIELGSHSIKAAFGLDLIEDAAVHAAHAAFAVHRAIDVARLGPEPLVRLALHTAEMRVGRADERVEIDADARRSAGEVLEALVAAAVREPIVVSDSTRSLLERRFDLEPITVADGTRPLWRVVRLADADHHATPFVSRVREMTVLDDLLTQVEEGRGQGVVIAGDPGIGKTRLLHEFRRRTRDRAIWLQGAAVSFGTALPLHPVIDVLKNAFAVQPTDSADAIAARIDSGTEAFGESFTASVPFLRALLLPDTLDESVTRLDPRLRRAGIFEAIARYVHAASQARPVILVLEDLHWMDPATGDFLTLMAENLVSGRILLCVTHRTGDPLVLTQSAFATQFTLTRVSPADWSVMGSSLLGGGTLSPDLQQLIEERTDGNPFFVEEVLRSLHEGGLLRRRGDEVSLARPVGRLDVPDTIRDVLLGRLGRLDHASREVLRVASVIGREFPRRVLERVLPDAQVPLDERLRALRAAELIRNTRVWPDVVYAFKHALTQDVTYEAQSDAERRAEHARIGEAIEQVYADRLSDHYGVLAHHFTQAERWDKSLDYLLAAAQQAELAFATHAALALYDRALTSAGRLGGGAGDPETLIKIHHAKAQLYAVTSDFALSAEEGERMLPLARLIGDRTREADALVTIAWASMWGRRLDAAIRYSREALAVAEPAGALAAQGRAHFTYAWVRGVTGGLDESEASFEKARSMSNAAGDAVQHSMALSAQGLLRNWAGDFSAAARLQYDALALAREKNLLVPLLFNGFLRGLTLTGKGDYDEAFAAFTEGLSLAERIGDEAIHHRLLNCMAWLLADLGDLEQAEVLNARSAEIGRRRTDPGTQPNAELNLADIWGARGELDRAQDQYDAVLKYYRSPSTSLWMKFRYSIRMFIGLGELALARHDLAAARAHHAESLTLATRGGSKKNLVKAWRLGGQIALASREIDAANALFRSSRDLAESVGNPVQHWKAELALGQFLSEAGRADEALRAFQRAGVVIQRVSDRLREPRLRAAFEKNADVRLIRDRIASV